MRHTLNAAVALLALATLPGCLDPSADGNLVPKTVDEDPSLSQLSLNDSKFHVETFGDAGAPVIVMLHGGPGVDYRGMLRLRNPVSGRRLEDDHLLVYWDQRGCGLSKRHDAKDITLATYDADLDALIDHFSPRRPVVLIGDSWGGMYATQYITQHPDKVAGAALLEAGPLTSARLIRIQDQIMHLDLFSEWLNDYTWAQGIVSADDHARADYMFMLGQLGDAEPGFHKSTTDREPIWRLGAVANAAIQYASTVDGKPSYDFTRGLDRFKTKVLFEASANNTVTGAAFQREQMRDFVSAELHVIADSGHDFPWRRPEATLSPIFDYLTEIDF
jgi:proline iminopeptidase